MIPFSIGGISPLSTTTGALSRLVNLGYYRFDSTRSTAEEDNQRKIAILNFQQDYELEATGILDAATVAKLGELVGSDKGL